MVLLTLACVGGSTGGYTICKVDGCTKRAKSRGICWSHGGGTRCKADDCTKIAVSLGLCWAHGGGKSICIYLHMTGAQGHVIDHLRWPELITCYHNLAGKRCVAPNCRKPASERTNNFCPDHYSWSSNEGQVANI